MFETVENRKLKPMRTFGTVSVPGTRAGAIVSLGLVIIAWIAIPVARIFILDVRAGVAGGIVFDLAARAGAEVESGSDLVELLLMRA